ncbi:shikimate dehydrogenase family protein [Psychroflexus sp. ALD_RP9]|uniref:shikimate dehydrogenase family protein n=1 Tax=Psychroflexus sp. ALD_RP9 TaxID=2777186 RepID=UPI001A8C8C71|nr:shikimate dehydrogenase [Psychroflexus sp. ALD_RP9]QSS97164.1 shikimate dehydrogenase [Psychroflexus sp. ALD_RP9]
MDVYGLVGKDIDYSFSKSYFSKKFQKEGIKASYKNFDLTDLTQLSDILKSNPDLKGFNVTIPYKTAIIPFLDDLDSQAKSINAVNTVKIENKRLKGYNTDIYGFTKSMFPLIENHHEKALVLGTGGASKAIKKSLNSIGFETQLVSRTKSPNIITYKDLDQDIIQSHQVIVNCTPLGTHPKIDDHPPIPYQFLTDKHLLYDLVYNPPITTFLALGKEHGAKFYNGQKMLELQAEKAWEIWNS